MAFNNGGNGNGNGNGSRWAAIVAAVALGGFIIQSLSLSADVGEKAADLRNAERRIERLEADVREFMLERRSPAPVFQNQEFRQFVD